MANKNVPYFVVIDPLDNGTETCDPMSTDVLVEQFDFGCHTESDLDIMLGGCSLGGTRDVRCSENGYDDEPQWTITVKRVSYP